MPYIIPLDNFMGPLLKEQHRKKQQSSAEQLCSPPPPLPSAPLPSAPSDLPQLGLFYADLLGERMGTAAAERHGTGKKGDMGYRRDEQRTADGNKNDITNIGIECNTLFMVIIPC